MKRSRRTRTLDRKWQPLERGTPVPKSQEQLDAQFEHCRKLMPALTLERFREVYQHAKGDELWMNDRYVVIVIRHAGEGPDGSDVVHLSIRRQDRGAARDWRDFQRIKNQLVGPECEGIELFPAESRLVDMATQFHLWCISDPTYRFPIGWHSQRFVDSESVAGSVQRPVGQEEGGSYEPDRR